MHEELLRRFLARRQQERRPVHAVKAQNVLGEQVHRRPEALEVLTRRVAQRAAVVDERISPDVRDLLRIPRDRHAPRLRRSTDREVAQSAGDEAPRFVVAVTRQDEVGTFVVELEEPVLVGGEPEEPVLLFEPLGLGAVVGAPAVDELGLRLESFAADAVPAGIHVLVDIPVVVDPLEEPLDEALVPFIARPDEEVVDDVQAPGQLLPRSDDPVCVLLGLESLLRRHARHLVGVLVHARQEVGLVPTLAVMPREDVRRDRRVRVSQRRRRVHVVDRCRHVEAHRCPW